jgi:hypothetical protein
MAFRIGVPIGAVYGLTYADTLTPKIAQAKILACSLVDMLAQFL